MLHDQLQVMNILCIKRNVGSFPGKTSIKMNQQLSFIFCDFMFYSCPVLVLIPKLFLISSQVETKKPRKSQGINMRFDTVKRYWYKYCFKKYRIVPFHSSKELLTILAAVKLSFIRYKLFLYRILNMTIHNKIYMVTMQ